jgi:maleate isomerase
MSGMKVDSTTRSIAPADPLEVIGPNGRIGLVALATDLCSESDLRSMLPAGVEIFTNRVANANPTTGENLRAMAPDIGRAAAGIVPDVDLDVMIYGCTSGTVVNGEEEVMGLMQEARGSFPCTTPVTAAMEAIQTFGARQISILTPYLQSLNTEVAKYFSGRGLDVLNIAGFDLASDADMTGVSLESIYRAAVEICDEDAELLFISCTALRSAQVAERIEQAIGRPVVTSNQALAWHALELIGKPYSVSGYGSLFSRHLQLQAA